MTIQITDNSPKTYLVLGMHQGGTSFIAKALQEQGIDMGIIETGVYENLEFVTFNNRTLSNAGGNWYRPPNMERIVESIKKFVNI